MSEPNGKTALKAIEEALRLLRSTSKLEGAAKEGVEALLEIAVEKLRHAQAHP
jgi:hypothetical protein